MDLAAYISTRALNEGNRSSIQRLQQRLGVAQQEVSSGRLADVGKTLGARTSETVSLRQEMARLSTLSDTNASVSSRLSVSQQALGGIGSTAETFVGTIIGARNSATGPSVAANAARAALSGITDGLNTGFGGENLFGGINTGETPLNNYFAQPTSPARQAVADAFQATFGFSQSDPQVASITPAQMQGFLDTALTPLFEEPAWSTNWSNASDETIESRISASEVIETSASANEAAFRKLAKAYVMLGDLGVENMNRETFSTVVGNAITAAGEAVQDVAVVQSTLGLAQERVAKANTKIDVQADIITNRINGLEAVDPFDAAVRVTSLLTQIETSYALTARIQNLTILNYL